MSIGARVRARRERLGLSQRELADRLGMPATLLSRLERGGVPNPGAEVLKRLALSLHCSIDWLVELYDEPVQPAPREAVPVG